MESRVGTSPPLALLLLAKPPAIEAEAMAAVAFAGEMHVSAAAVKEEEEAGAEAEAEEMGVGVTMVEPNLHITEEDEGNEGGGVGKVQDTPTGTPPVEGPKRGVGGVKVGGG